MTDTGFTRNVKPTPKGREVLDFIVENRNLGISAVTMNYLADPGADMVEVQVLCYVLEDEKTGEWLIEPLAIVVPDGPFAAPGRLSELPEPEHPGGEQPALDVSLGGMVCQGCGAPPTIDPESSTMTVNHKIGCIYRRGQDALADATTTDENAATVAYIKGREDGVDRNPLYFDQDGVFLGPEQAALHAIVVQGGYSDAETEARRMLADARRSPDNPLMVRLGERAQAWLNART